MTNPKCGTRAGWNTHMRAKEPVCDDCQYANTLYARDNRRRKGVGRSLTFPVDTPRHDIGLGSTIARGIRESA